MDNPYKVIIRPLLTEKVTKQTSQLNKYAFEVLTNANKVEIRRAVEEIFQVRVAKVNTLHVRPKERRLGRFPKGRTRHWKKAVVTLVPGQRIPELETA